MKLRTSETGALNESEYNDYKVYRDLKNSLDTAFDEGKAEGIEQGIEQGIELEKLSTARKLKDLHAPIEMIVEATGLSKSEIEKL